MVFAGHREAVIFLTYYQTVVDFNNLLVLSHR